jgi:hypothetical protein
MFTSQQKLKLTTQEGVIYEQKLKIDEAKKEADNLRKIRKEEMLLELNQKRMKY